MLMTRFQKTATAALISVLCLMFVGPIVRVTGSGMGCPDWPTCWGCLIPPTKAADVNFNKLPIERFKQKAQRMGRDPATITEESLRREFNPRHVWTEFINRLFSVVVGICSLATFIGAFSQRERRPLVFWMAFSALILVFINAWMGARVVYSGLHPGVLTAHLAMAMGLLGLLAYCAWRGTDTPWRIVAEDGKREVLQRVVIGLLLVTVAEGIIGSQVREITDELAKFHLNAPRSTWTTELEGTWQYLVHRSFSWAVLLMAVWAWNLTRKYRHGGAGPVENIVFGIVIAQMVLGIVMARIHIYAWVQVLHVGLAAVLLTFIWLWLFGLSAAKK